MNDKYNLGLLGFADKSIFSNTVEYNSRSVMPLWVLGLIETWLILFFDSFSKTWKSLLKVVAYNRESSAAPRTARWSLG